MEYYPGTKQLRYKHNYLIDKKICIYHGLQEGWYPNGQQYYKLNYDNGNRHGLHESWYSNGKHEFKGSYLNGNPDGLQESWYSDGKREFKGSYVDGKKHGLHESWYSDGKQRYKENYIRVATPEGTCGQKHGLQESWCPNIKQYFKYNIEIIEEEYEQYLNSIEKGILNILHIGKNSLDLIIKQYLGTIPLDNKFTS